MSSDRSPKIPSSDEKMKHVRQESELFCVVTMIPCIQILVSVQTSQSVGGNLLKFTLLSPCHHHQIIARTQHLSSTPTRFRPDVDLWPTNAQLVLVCTNTLQWPVDFYKFKFMQECYVVYFNQQLCPTICSRFRPDHIFKNHIHTYM